MTPESGQRYRLCTRFQQPTRHEKQPCTLTAAMVADLVAPPPYLPLAAEQEQAFSAPHIIHNTDGQLSSGLHLYRSGGSAMNPSLLISATKPATLRSDDWLQLWIELVANPERLGGESPSFLELPIPPPRVTQGPHRTAHPARIAGVWCVCLQMDIRVVVHRDLVLLFEWEGHTPYTSTSCIQYSRRTFSALL